MIYRLGVDGGGTKTEAILVDPAGQIVARATGPGCNPSLAGPAGAKAVLAELIKGLLAPFPSADADFAIESTLLCMAGNPGFWAEFAASLTTFGRVTTQNDSVPVLQLATGGKPGLVIHAGTGSFVAAHSAASPEVHYAGGLGWKFGDPGSGYDIGRRVVVRALLELQGWSPPSGLAKYLQDQTGIQEGQAISRFYYNDSASNPKIAQLAAGALELAEQGNAAARELVLTSVTELLGLAHAVAAKLFPDQPVRTIPAGLSGPILTHPLVAEHLKAMSSLPLQVIAARPIEGVRQLLMRVGPQAAEGA
jgi:N-acetylglucosamine kinase-like BadF-type ATPase